LVRALGCKRKTLSKCGGIDDVKSGVGLKAFFTGYCDVIE
jgi:hypothetical protein